MSDTTIYSRGSEWRKWDLHVHTPASVLNNGFGSDWDFYVQNLFRILIQKEIAAVGITDYFTIDGYKKIRQEYLANDAKLKKLFSNDEIEQINKILVVPNIEFRSNIFVGESSVNFHIILSEALSIRDIEEKFLHEIDFIYQGEPQSASSKRKLKETNLIELGERLRREHSKFNNYSDLFAGMMNAVVDHEQVSEILANKSNIFGGKYIFAVVADEDLSNINWDSRDHHTRKVLIQKSDLLLSSNGNTRKWGLAKPPYTDGADKFIGVFNTLKACIHGSDAHEFKYIGHPCAKRGISSHDCANSPQDCELRFCWIKADPIFEGIRQILYEPEDRVIIQQGNPTPLKSSQSISGFSIASTTMQPELKFCETELLLNSGLVAVTGGKGSGKTALVDLIANVYEDRASCDDSNSFVKRVSEEKDTQELQTGIQLVNSESYTKEIKDASFLEGASIVYIAQGELEKHVGDPTHLETYINSLIIGSDGIRDSELLFDYESINEEVSEICENILTLNKVIFEGEETTNSKVEEELRKETKRLQQEQKDVENKIKILASGISEQNVKAAEADQIILSALRDKKTDLTELGLTIKEALKFLELNIAEVNTLIEKINKISAKLTYDRQFNLMAYSDTASLEVFIKEIRAGLKKTIGEIEAFQKKADEKEKGLREHSKLLDKRKEISKSLENISVKISIISSQKEQLAKNCSQRATLYEDLLAKRILQRNKYLAIISAFAQRKNDILNDLEFTADLLFDEPRFFQTMSEIIDQRKIEIQGQPGKYSDVSFFTKSINELIADPTESQKNMVSKEVEKLKNIIVQNQKRAETISRQTLYDAIFSDYLSVMPTVKYKRVKLTKLSLGQKATVLIKIYLAQGENPIIIDSHDDHLDNEFIMDELVKALREAKQHRQVIVVSNNGNVVVNSDAEQVIIARRDEAGEISYVAGSLENPALRPILLKVLEGGETAFDKRKQKYRISK